MAEPRVGQKAVSMETLKVVVSVDKMVFPWVASKGQWWDCSRVGQKEDPTVARKVARWANHLAGLKALDLAAQMAACWATWWAVLWEYTLVEQQVVSKAEKWAEQRAAE